jgi:hypothetical protein
MARLIPLLTHLEPPQACGGIRLDRFSPYFNHPHAFGLREVRAHSYYRYVFPLEEPDLDRLAYYFEFEWPNAPYPEEYTCSLRRAVGRWKAAPAKPRGQRPRLDLRRGKQAIFITDTRSCAACRRHRLTGLAAEIYLLCDTARTLPSLINDLGGRISDSHVRRILRSLRQAGLLVEDEGHYLSLAVWRDRAKWTSQGAFNLDDGKITAANEGRSQTLSIASPNRPISRDIYCAETERSNRHA